MPLFAFIGRDGRRGTELRPLHRQRHLANLEPLAERGCVRFAGPLLDEEGNPRGSLVVFEADDLAGARAIVARDPYVTEGVFERVELHETRAVLPR